MNSLDSNYSLSEADKVELEKLVSVLEISNGTTIIFAIAPESSPHHPVVKKLKESLEASEEHFQCHDFFYSDNSFHNFLYSLDDSQQNSQLERKLVMAFGLDQLLTPRLKEEMRRLNLGREELFGRNFVLIFWINKSQFLEEFRHRAPDFWDWREKVVEFETRHPVLYSYLEKIIAENSYLRMSGVMQVNRQVDIFLDQIYVSLQAQRRQRVTETLKHSHREFEAMTGDGFKMKMMDASLHDWEPSYYEPKSQFSSVSNTKTVIEKVDLFEAVRKNPYSVILGAPGAGKTTLLQYLALHFAIAKRDNQEKNELEKTLLPIFFRIADYAEQLKQKPELPLLEYLDQFYHQWNSGFPAREDVETEVAVLLIDAMRQGECLILLDGLDEVFDQQIRRSIVERINQFVEKFPTNKFVITSRIAGYYDVQLSDRFAEFTIEDMDSEQVERFLYRWCRVIEEAQQPEAGEEQWQKKGIEQAQDILRAIEANEGVKRLTANPLLLTILALIHRNGEHLPRRRVKLYELAAQTLIEDWQLGKKLPDAPKVVLKETEVVQLLAPLAYWMHEEKPSGLVTQAEVEDKLAIELAQLDDTDSKSDSVRREVAEFLRKVRETTGLFVERTPGVYGFMHLTFEEYFAARYIVDNEQSEILRLIQKHRYEPRWEEPILLAIGYYGTYFPTQLNKLMEKLFSTLKGYNPILQCGEIQIKKLSADNVKLLWFKAENESADNLQQSEFIWQDLLLAGQAISEVEVKLAFRKDIIHKLVLTYAGVDADFEDDITKKLLRLLRKIEFNQKTEVIDILKKTAHDTTLSEEIRIKAKTAILYIACGDLARLGDRVIEIVNQLEPSLFCSIAELMVELGEDITLALESSEKHHSADKEYEEIITFLTGISYIREGKHEKAIEILTEIKEKSDSRLISYTYWALARCYQEKEEYEKANNHYSQSNMADYPQKNDLYIFWIQWGWCQTLDKKYEQSLVYLQKALAIAKELIDDQKKANIFYNIGRVYQSWENYEQAINYHQQSREIYQQLGREKDVANQWYWMAACYREWGKYEPAIECQNQVLALRQQLDDQVRIALAYYQFCKIYQGWGKYEQAINSHRQSRELYQQLGREKNVANQWYWMAVCYREWGKYQQAIECQNQDLALRQKLENQVNIADAYYQFGHIYQGWGKYEQAINYYQQSRELYQQLGREKNVANQWYWMAVCYREWGKYEPAIECENQDLVLRQQLDDQVRIALAYYQLGQIYQGWGKYEQAINYYQQSRELYQQLGREKNVADLWYWMADCYREWGKYELAIECENQDLARRQKLDDQVNIADAYNEFGRIYQGWGKYEQAINYYQQSRELYQQLGREKNVANQWYWMAVCYREWGKYEPAIECENQNLARCQQLDDRVGLANAFCLFGRIYQGWGKYEQAINYYQQSRELYQQLGREKNVADLWYWMADCYREWGKYELAIECENQDLARRQQLDDQVNIADAYNQFGRIYQGWGKYELAINYYQQSRELNQQLGREKNVANQWYWMADCYREWGKYEQAVECQNQVLALRQQLDDQVGIALAYYQLGRIYQGWGKYEQARNYYQQSRELYQQLGREKNVAILWYWMADCHREWGKYEPAIECENQDLARRQQLDDQVGIALAYYQLGRIYQGWGKYEQARNYYQQSRELYQQLGREKDVAILWYWMADCYREGGKYEPAIECENQDLALRQQLDDQINIADAYNQSGRIYRDWGKYEQAINYYQQSRELYQQLGREKNVANQWYWMADCYREGGKYEPAIECENQDLALRQQLDDQVGIALAYYQLGRIYQGWGKYEQAINSHQQSRELYQQLGQEKNVANQWYRMAACYREWGKYEQAIECENQDLTLRQQLDDQVNIALAYYQLGRIYQGWGKYEQAINYYQQSREVYQHLGREKYVAILWYWMAVCYREWGKYEPAIECENQDLVLRQKLDDQVNIADAYNQFGQIYRDWGKYELAIKYFQDSCNLYKHLNISEGEAWSLRRLAYAQILLAKTDRDKALTLNLLTQAEQNLEQAIQLNTTGDYKKNLAYDYTILALLYSERLRLLPCDDSSKQEQIAQFEQYYNTGLTYLTELGQTVDRADEVLDMARAYLEVEALENLDRAQEIAQASLQTFQEYNRHEQKAKALKLLGEIYLKRIQHYPSAKTIASEFFTQSLQIYQQLDLHQKAVEVEQLLHSFNS